MTKDIPLVSVVLPIYNVEKYLDQCVASVVSQTYSNLEIILIDDGATDSCPRKCDEWAMRDSRIRVIHKQNQGLGMARNSGLEASTGDYICFFDSDDFVDEDTIERCVCRAVEESADVVLFGLRSVSTDGRMVLGENVPKCPKPTYSGEEVVNEFLPYLVGPDWGTGEDWHLMASACGCFADNHMLNACGFKFTSEREIISEDVYSMLGFYQHVRCVSVIGRAFYNYRVNPKSLTHVYRPDRLERVREFYQASVRLVNKCDYPVVVKERLSAPYVSFTIAALKELARSNESKGTKRKLILGLADDPIFNEVADRACRSRHFGWKRHVLLRSVQRRRVDLVLTLCSKH